MSDLWLIYRRRSNKKLGSEHVAASADVSDNVQLERCLTLLPEGARYEVIDDLGGKQSGRTDKRDGWRRVVARVEEGGVAGVIAYDISRLARNARLVLNLQHVLEQSGADLRIVQVPGTRFGSAEGRLILTMLAAAAAFQADYDSQRMRSMMRGMFEAGTHRGGDPFGYATIRDEKGDVQQPRSLEIVPEEAEVVRRVFALLADHPFSEIAAILNREGALRREPGPWTNSSVKDLWRRREFYRANVTAKRGLEVREGRHPRILSDEEFRDAAVGVLTRTHIAGPKSRAKRRYLLRGKVYCRCGARMRGRTAVARGTEWRYYACPVRDKRTFRHDDEGNLVACDAPGVPAEPVEQFVTDVLSAYEPTDEDWEWAEAQVRRGTGQPTQSGSDKERARLTRRLEALRKQHEWGDITDEEYRRLSSETRDFLSALPTSDGKVGALRQMRRASSFGDAIAASSTHPELLEGLVQQTVKRIDVCADGQPKVVWTDSWVLLMGAEEVAAGGEPASLWRPRTDSNRRRRP